MDARATPGGPERARICLDLPGSNSPSKPRRPGRTEPGATRRIVNRDMQSPFPSSPPAPCPEPNRMKSEDSGRFRWSSSNRWKAFCGCHCTFLALVDSRPGPSDRAKPRLGVH
ncbi:hypothetical protein KM043_000759 [Ampulex compressa]|nr:hypothetical protein KM043_000759 [Ampulex compressa]